MDGREGKTQRGKETEIIRERDYQRDLQAEEKYRKVVRTQRDGSGRTERGRVKKRLRKEGKQTDNWAMASAPQPAVSPTICLLSDAEKGSEAQGKTQSKK